MFWASLLFLATIGAIIGWITNVLAIKLIFRPLNPIKIPILNIKIQGLIPKRREELAKSIGNIVETELISIEEIIEKFLEDQNKAEIIFKIKRKIRNLIEQKLPPIIPSSFKQIILKYVEDVIEAEADKALDEISKNIIDKAISKIKIADIIEEKINDFELERLEKIVISIAKKELKHIEILGGILGFLIGLLQGFILLLY